MTISRVAVIFDNKVRPDTTGVYCRRALGTLVEVEHFLPDELARIPRRGFDLYLNIDDGLEYDIPSDLRPAAWWAIDTHLNFERYLPRARKFDFVFSAQRDGADHFRQAGIRWVNWLPLACDPEMHCRQSLPKQHDICFIGHVFPGARSELLSLLQRRFANVLVGERYFEEMARAYSASRLVFNCSILNDINMRVFEALACGSMLITNDLRENGQDELFEAGVHLETYREAEELLDKAAYYLRHEQAREKIAAKGREEALAWHTYRHRMDKVLRDVAAGLSIKRAVPAGLSGRTVDRICDNERAPDWLELIPKDATQILVLGAGAQEAAKALKSSRPVRLCGLASDSQSPSGAPTHLDQVLRASADEIDPAFAQGFFDVAVCVGALEDWIRPIETLKRLRSWLQPAGRVVARIPNMRFHSRIQALLAGHWPNGLGQVATHQRWFFTRREIEKLFWRAGFRVESIQVVPGLGYEEWREQGQRGELRVGRLHIAGMPVQDAEEFYAEGYFVTAIPENQPSHGLTSIIVVTHNELAYTRQCLVSVRDFTDEPFELLVVDNGSNDGTVEYLQSQKDVKLIANTENRGFPAAANQAMREAKGKHIVLLNNDCVVTTGWLRRMLRALTSDASIGLVGPCSNFVSGEQQVEVGYEVLEELDGFAWDWGKAQNEKIEDTDRLVGFCLMASRGLIDRIGLLDERFGIGCFDDDDYTRRAIEAGFRAVIARDVFVHHFGGRTFIGTKTDFAALMEHNRRLFEEKWSQAGIRRQASGAREMAGAIGQRSGIGRRNVEAGEERLEFEDRKLEVVTKSVMVDGQTSEKRGREFALEVARDGGLLLKRARPLISLCMIARDNAKTIGPCLESIRPWVDEMIVVDTGSRDETAPIAKRLGARVYYFPWCDSFSAARNESLRHARGEWIFWMDTDDTIDEANGRKLRALAGRRSDPPILGYVMQVHFPGPGSDGRSQVTVVDHLKLFRNLPELRFDGRIHEQILPAIRAANGEVAFTDVFVVHTGYDHSPEGQKRKLARDLRLLELELAERPEHPFTLFNLGMTYADVGEHDKAVDYLERSIRESGPTDSHLGKAFALLVNSLHQSRQLDEAWRACERGLSLFPKDIELRFRGAMLLHDVGRLHEAASAYQDILEGSRDRRHFSSVVQGISGFITRQNLAVVHQELGDWVRAEQTWRKVTEEAPNYRDGWRGLAEVLIRQQKLQAAWELADKLSAMPNLRSDALLIRGRILCFQGNLADARGAFEQAVVERGEDLEPLRVLAQFLFEHGDPSEAEDLLKLLCETAPTDASAFYNLGTVYLQQGRFDEALDACRQSLRLRPNYVPSLLNQGYALRGLGRLDEAVSCWKRALQFDPQNAAAEQALSEAGSTAAVPASGTSPNAPRQMRKIRLDDREIEIPFATRGPVDEAIVREVWERDVYGVRALKDVPTVIVDIGAHIGAFTVFAARMWPSARIIACEADPENCELLRQNVSGLDRVEIVEAAICGEDTNGIDFYSVADKFRQNSGGGSCLAGRGGQTKLRVPALSAATLWRSKEIETCGFLKLDCEGSEIEVLQALAKAKLLAKVQHLSGEWHATDNEPKEIEKLKRCLRRTLRATHRVIFASNSAGREGYFMSREDNG
jgi:FkbM family methyltransferase